MRHRGFWLLLLLFVPALMKAEEPIATAGHVHWVFSRLDEIGGQKTTVIGSPRLIDTAGSKWIEFDGQSAIFVDVNPLAGLSKFTAEVVFRPAVGGEKEQRFVHMQEEGSENRLLFELRLIDEGRWFLDTFMKSGGGNYTLLASKSPHPLGLWHHAAVVMDSKEMRHYVNGELELATPIDFTPQKKGKTSLGVRQNKVSWYRGAIRELRITPRALNADDFLKP